MWQTTNLNRISSINSIWLLALLDKQGRLRVEGIQVVQRPETGDENDATVGTWNFADG